MVPSPASRNIARSGLCCVCGWSQCSECVDHQKICLEQLHAIIQSSKQCKPEVDSLKKMIAEVYSTLKKTLIEQIHLSEFRVQERLNRLYFSQTDASMVNISLICQVMEKNYQQLPNKQVYRMVKVLRKARQRGEMSGAENQFNNGCNQQFAERCRRFAENFNFNQIKEGLGKYFADKNLLGEELPALKIRKSLSEISNPEEHEIEHMEVYQWKNVKLKRNSKTLQLSNKRITDQDMIRSMPIISSFSKLQQLEIRNNKITALTCQLIASNMGFLKAIDIRGNPVGDEGVLKIVNAIPLLKSLCISETKAGDHSGKAIAEGIKDLQTLWSEQTYITGQVAYKIGKKQKLKVMSLAGNPIQEPFIVQLKKLFSCKGYLVI